MLRNTTKDDSTFEDEKPPQTNVFSLNEDSLIEVFKHLDTESKGRAAQVCKTWNEIFKYKSLWKNAEANLSSATCNPSTYDIIVTRGVNRFHLLNLNAEICEFLRRIPYVEQLQLTNKCMQYLNLSRCFKSVSELKVLTFSTCRDTTDLIIHLIVRHLSSLVELNFVKCCNINNGSLLVLSGLKGLKKLYVSGYISIPLSIHDIGIRCMTGSYLGDGTGMISLEQLHLRQMKNLTNNAFKDIGMKLVNLVSLDCRECERLTDSGLKYLIQLQKLESLSLAHCMKVTDAGLKYIAQLRSLKYLDLTGCLKITSVGLMYLGQLKNLKYIDISFCFCITDAGKKHFQKLTSRRGLICFEQTFYSTQTLR